MLLNNVFSTSELTSALPVCSNAGGFSEEGGAPPPHCYYVSPFPVTWPEAHQQCHGSGGWVLNCLDCSQLFPVTTQVLTTTGKYTIVVSLALI